MCNADILQLVYLDASSIFILHDLISYSSNVCIPTISNNNNNNENNVNRDSINQLLIISYHTDQLSTIMRTYRIKVRSIFPVWQTFMNHVRYSHGFIYYCWVCTFGMSNNWSYKKLNLVCAMWPRLVRPKRVEMERQ